ncbi:hypothetical protein PCASD_17475 [Puccinia coronata f. sp. avenae]|uniref:Uncharacterized protein n=1 Tax=Puccinia coronata f. sp. avenae TaxID=200324 RepID=A0A2N5TSN6_9BASI|nr:hypothetical protein PCASD_17475 [Puccinia coronata f. sp. avenae]
MFLNLLAIFAAIALVPGTWTLEVSPQEMARAESQWIELPNNMVDNWYPDTVKNVVEGKGSTIQREEHVQNAMLAWKRRIGMDLGQYMKGKLGWPGRIVPQQLPYLSERHYGDSELVRFKENDFPWRLSQDVKHRILWFQLPMVTPEAFKRLDHDPPYPNREYENIHGQRVAALMEYLNEHDMYGWTGLPPAAVNRFRQSSAENHEWTSKSGVSITREEATQAMRWVARHTDRLIEEEFPASRFETVWNRTNYRVRSIKDPNHLHVLVIPKSSPYSYANMR